MYAIVCHGVNMCMRRVLMNLGFCLLILSLMCVLVCLVMIVFRGVEVHVHLHVVLTFHGMWKGTYISSDRESPTAQILIPLMSCLLEQ